MYVGRLTPRWDEISEQALSRPITEDLRESMESSASIAAADPDSLSKNGIHMSCFRIITQVQEPHLRMLSQECPDRFL